MEILSQKWRGGLNTFAEPCRESPSKALWGLPLKEGHWSQTIQGRILFLLLALPLRASVLFLLCKVGFLKLDTNHAILDWILGCRHCPVHCRVVISLSTLGRVTSNVGWDSQKTSPGIARYPLRNEMYPSWGPCNKNQVVLVRPIKDSVVRIRKEVC